MDARRWTLVKRLAMAAGASAAVALLGWAFRTPPVPVGFGAVVRGPLDIDLVQEGRTRIRERFVVSAPVAGRLLRLAVKAGDPVRAGMPVGVVVPPDAPLRDLLAERELQARAGAAEAAVSRAEAGVAKAEAALEEARVDLARTRRLVAGGSLPGAALDRAAAEFRTREEAWQEARQAAHGEGHALEAARGQLERRGAGRERQVIRAPRAGVVLRVYQESETVVPAGAPVLELGLAGDLEVVADALSADAVQVRPGMAARIEGWGGPPLAARVRRVEPGAITKRSPLGVEEQRVNVLLDFLGPPESRLGLGDAYRVEAVILLRHLDDVLKVPVAAVFRKGAGWAVYESRGGRARSREVRLGARNAQEAEVLGGLAAGDRVILYPGELVREGVPVKAAND